jgi:hypothetical protein
MQRGSLRVVIGPQEVQGNIRIVANNPTIVRRRRDVKQRAGREIDYPPVAHRGYCPARNDESHMFDLTELRAGKRPHVHGPFPPRLVGSLPQRQPTEPDDLKFTALEFARLIRMLESFKDDLVHSIPPGLGSLKGEPFSSVQTVLSFRWGEDSQFVVLRRIRKPDRAVGPLVSRRVLSTESREPSRRLHIS